MKKAERLNGVIFSIKEKGRLSAKDLSEIFEVSQRTIYRDIDALSQLKVPIIAYDGLGGGYEIDEKYFMPSIKLSEKEVIIFLMVLKLGDEIQLPNYKSDYSLLKSKVYNTLTGVDKKRIDLLLDRLSFHLNHVIPSGYAKDVLSCIIEAFLDKKQLSFVYYTPAKDQYVKRHVSANDLHFDTGGWYLTAYCHLRKDKRVFRLDRISDIKVLETENILMDEVFLSKNEKFLPRIYTLEIDRQLYRLIKDNFYFKKSKILEDDKSLILSIETKFESVITQLVLENPLHIRILGPPNYVQKIKGNIMALYDKYI